MQKLVNALPLLVVVGLIWFQFFHKPDSDKPKLAKPPSETTSQRCQVIEGSVYDGDTFQVRCDGKTSKIRLCGIDAPEVKQPLGIESRDYLRSLLNKAKGEVIVVEMDRDRYGRTVAEVLFDTPQGEESVQEEMLTAGMAYHYKQFSGNCHNADVFDTAEEIGRSQKLGVWQLPGGGQRPWDYRKQNQS
ncbi:MAG: thermonuclease family protein [Microcoleus sp. PH2017_25_DOB_D_A]|uniref:thermonuclease family protein n=1 Tax=unclassified Microcoleus TaxID=2642155 RepID=UPI001DFE5BDC|nr:MULTISPECIES: thermonuclease family protein [unclassified Microcoleus]MCC3535596.1 thermonuclease family protein [Microcoleus sp. PH2017_25_DOB_D_A]MCC3545435.1 thermonuclease family protein [Microcoleus sp. PH2017_24_DOB_U_A]